MDPAERKARMDKIADESRDQEFTRLYRTVFNLNKNIAVRIIQGKEDPRQLAAEILGVIGNIEALKLLNGELALVASQKIRDDLQRDPRVLVSNPVEYERLLDPICSNLVNKGVIKGDLPL